MKQILRPSDKPLSSKQEIFKRARNTTKVVLEPKRSLQNETSCLVECFLKTGEMWHLQELATILQQADEDLINTPPASNTALRKFIDNDAEFEEEDCALMAEELFQLWPELIEIDATDFPILKSQLIENDISLEYRLIRPFIAEACFQIRSLQARNEDIAPDLAEEALTTVRRVLSSCESTSVALLSPEEESLLIPSIVSALKNMLQAARDFDKNLKDNCGDQTLDGTLHDVWEKYADALDTDAAKKAWFEAARYLTAAMKHKQRGLADMIEDLIEVLDEMRLDSDD